MPYFLRHYSTFVDRMIFYDDHSVDGTRDLISECSKTVLRNWPGSHGMVDDEFLSFANEQWKEARGYADWVIWVDADEFLYHPKILEVLERYLNEKVQVPKINGFTMLSHKFPTTDGQIYEEIRTGFPDDVWSKATIFRDNMVWNVGRHSMNHDRFKPRFSKDYELKLLHYRALGWDYLEARHSRNWERVPEHCRAQNLGNNCSPGWVGHHGLEWFKAKFQEPLLEVI